MTWASIQRSGWWAWRLFALAALLSVGLSLWDYAGRWYTPRLELRNFVMLGLFWGARLAGPFLLWGLVAQAVALPWSRRWRPLLAALLVSVGLWASLVEPELIRVRTTTLTGIPAGAQPVRLAVIADIHWGLFLRDHQLQRLVERLNALEVDAVLVAGDWVHEPPRDLHAGLAPLARIRAPVFGVMGNHDVQAPGPDLTEPLRAALQAHGVRLLDGQTMDWRGWELVGLDDLWGGQPQAQIRALWPSGSAPAAPAPARLVVTHQPDTIALLPPSAAFLSLAGHTHGGQIWIPGLTPWFLRNTNTQQPWWNGLYTTPAGPLLVTPGIGTIGPPARLAVVPTIDVVELKR